KRTSGDSELWRPEQIHPGHLEARAIEADQASGYASSGRQMAKKPQELGCSLAVLAIGLPAFIIFHALPYLMLTVFYSYLVFLIHLFLNSPKRRQPTLADVGDEQIEAEIQALHAEQSQLLKEVSETRERGAAEGVRFLYPHDRFEMRSRRGQELNQSLEYLVRRSLMSLKRLGLPLHMK